MGSVLTNGGKCETEIGKHIEIVKDFPESKQYIDRQGNIIRNKEC